MARISEKQRMFVDTYLADKDLNAGRAYLSVYTSVKKQSTANVNASRLLAKPHVQEYLRERMAARRKRVEISQDKVLQELDKIGMANDVLADGINIEIRMADKLKALEMLGRHLGMWNDKLDITTDITLDFGGEPDGD